MEQNMTLEVQPMAPADNVFITNMAGRHIKITRFKINGMEFIPRNDPQPIPVTTTFGFLYKDKSWDKFERMILDIAIYNKQYSVDLNRDHYFGGGDFHYPGKGSQVNFMLFGVNTEATKIELCLTYGEYFGDTGAKRLLYSNDKKYLDVA